MRRLLIMILVIDLLMASILIAFGIQNFVARMTTAPVILQTGEDINKIEMDIHQIERMQNVTIDNQHQVLEKLNIVINNTADLH